MQKYWLLNLRIRNHGREKPTVSMEGNARISGAAHFKPAAFEGRLCKHTGVHTGMCTYIWYPLGIWK